MLKHLNANYPLHNILPCSRPNLAEMEDEFYDLSSFAVDDASMEGMSLLETVKQVKPTILIGKSSVYEFHFGSLQHLFKDSQANAGTIIFYSSHSTTSMYTEFIEYINVKSLCVNYFRGHNKYSCLTLLYNCRIIAENV